ncbi:uncharacterized protein [Amphiura filiformis]|uniref:uncharacterized protein isoform X2 n=1 Tax=Amphiura filiformis TaxID=82378 RepID=UPI003B21A1BA
MLMPSTKNMMKNTVLPIWLIFLTILISDCCGQCQQRTSGTCSYKVSHRESVKTSYQSSTRQVYYKGCGFANWARCTSYRQIYRTSYRTTYRASYSQAYQCCPGWQEEGGECKAICSSSCLNGGLCCTPNTCQCSAGYRGDQCQIPICSPSCLHGGTCVGPNVCVCREGLTGSQCQTSSGICPSNITTLNAPGQPGAIVKWNAFHLDQDVRITSIYAPGDFFPIGSTVVAYMFQSESLNSRCSFTVTVQDTEPPIVKCPNKAQYYTKTGTTTAAVQIDPPIITDNSGHVPNIFFYTSRSGKKYQEITGDSEFPIGQTRVVIDALDNSKNKASCNYIVTVTARCSKEMSPKPNGKLLWEPTIAGAITESLQRCPITTTGRNRGLATRNCTFDDNFSAVWGEVIENDCGQPMDFDETILSQMKITAYNINEAVDALKNITEKARQTKIDLDIVSVWQIMANVVSVSSPATYVAEKVAIVVDNIIGNSYVSEAKDQSTANITSQITKLFEQQIVQTMANQEEFMFDGANLALKATTVGNQDAQNGFGISLLKGNELIKGSTEIHKRKNSLFATTTKNETLRNDSSMAIWLPGGVFSLENDTKVSFVIFDDDSLFKSSTWEQNAKSSHGVISPIVSVTVIGTEVRNLSHPVILQTFCGEKYKSLDKTDDMWKRTSCVTWDYTLNDGIGDWSGDGCEIVDAVNGWITCHCYHLSTFAVVLEVPIENSNKTPLVVTIISKTGCAISILMLSIVLLLLFSRHVQLTTARKILLQISLSALIMYFLILIGIEIPRWANREIGCPIVGVLIHYFILTTISWMAVEVRSIYSDFTVDSEDKATDMRNCVLASIITWGLPLVVVGVPFALARDDYANGYHCYLGPGHVQRYGLFLPVGILVQHNLVTLILTTFRLLKDGTERSRQISLGTLKARLQDAFLITLALEIVWISKVLLHTSILEATLSLQITFSAFGSFMGVLIGFLFCVHQRDVRLVIKEICCCQKYRTNTKPIPPPRSTSQNIQEQLSLNPSSNHGPNPAANPGTNPSYYPSYLIPIGHTEPYADIVTSSSGQNNNDSDCLTYSYAACENVYEDYEKIDEGAGASGSIQSGSGEMLAMDRGKTAYEVEDVKETELNLKLLKYRNGTTKAKAGNDKDNRSIICDASVADACESDDSENDKYDFEYVPNLENFKPGTVAVDYWTEVKGEGNNSKIVPQKTQKSLKASYHEGGEGVDDEDYEPVETASDSKQTDIADYWTEVSQVDDSHFSSDADDADHYSYAECGFEDESGRDTDEGYEPVEPIETPSNKRATNGVLTDYWTEVDGDEDETHSYESFDTQRDADGDTDDDDYEKILID